MAPKVSPLAPAAFPSMPPIAGVRLATAAAGVKYSDRTDVMLALLEPGTSIAGVFTKSATRSAPVLDCQMKLGGSVESSAALLVNSGNANAFTGRAGEQSVERICDAVSAANGAPSQRVFTASTGVIGERLPDDRIVSVISSLCENAGREGFHEAAQAIMTTDTFAKGACKSIKIAGEPVNIAGIAKGSGMIAPDMATMLVYIFTDAKIEQSNLQPMLSRLADTTFNCITVDSDTSTSDTLICAATGSSGVEVTSGGPFESALHDVMLDLAHQVVRDGEGASKFVEVQVTGAANNEDAKRAALAIANSPLVKTAIAGEDPNWGRVVMAIGKSGAAANRDELSIWFGQHLVAEHGWVAESYSEEVGASYMKAQDLKITTDLGIGQGSATVWTCDLTHDYISINADYRS